MDKKFPINVDKWTPVADKNKCCFTSGNTGLTDSQKENRLTSIKKFFNRGESEDDRESKTNNSQEKELQVIVIKSDDKCKLYQAPRSHAAIRYSNVYVSLYPGEIPLLPMRTRFTGSFYTLEEDYERYVGLNNCGVSKHLGNFFSTYTITFNENISEKINTFLTDPVEDFNRSLLKAVAVKYKKTKEEISKLLKEKTDKFFETNIEDFNQYLLETLKVTDKKTKKEISKFLKEERNKFNIFFKKERDKFFESDIENFNQYLTMTLEAPGEKTKEEISKSLEEEISKLLEEKINNCMESLKEKIDKFFKMVIEYLDKYPLRTFKVPDEKTIKEISKFLEEKINEFLESLKKEINNSLGSPAEDFNQNLVIDIPIETPKSYEKYPDGWQGDEVNSGGQVWQDAEAWKEQRGTIFCICTTFFAKCCLLPKCCSTFLIKCSYKINSMCRGAYCNLWPCLWKVNHNCTSYVVSILDQVGLETDLSFNKGVRRIFSDIWTLGVLLSLMYLSVLYRHNTTENVRFDMKVAVCFFSSLFFAIPMLLQISVVNYFDYSCLKRFRNSINSLFISTIVGLRKFCCRCGADEDNDKLKVALTLQTEISFVNAIFLTITLAVNVIFLLAYSLPSIDSPGVEKIADDWYVIYLASITILPSFSYFISSCEDILLLSGFITPERLEKILDRVVDVVSTNDESFVVVVQTEDEKHKVANAEKNGLSSAGGTQLSNLKNSGPQLKTNQTEL